MRHTASHYVQRITEMYTGTLGGYDRMQNDLLDLFQEAIENARKETLEDVIDLLKTHKDNKL